MTEDTIRNRTLIVPSTICNGPVMFFLPRTPGGVVRSRLPLGDARVIIGAPGALRTIAVGVAAYSPVTRGTHRHADGPQFRTVLRIEHYRPVRRSQPDREVEWTPV